MDPEGIKALATSLEWPPAKPDHLVPVFDFVGLCVKLGLCWHPDADNAPYEHYPELPFDAWYAPSIDPDPFVHAHNAAVQVLDGGKGFVPLCKMIERYEALFEKRRSLNEAGDFLRLMPSPETLQLAVSLSTFRLVRDRFQVWHESAPVLVRWRPGAPESLTLSVLLHLAREAFADEEVARSCTTWDSLKDRLFKTAKDKGWSKGFKRGTFDNRLRDGEDLRTMVACEMKRDDSLTHGQALYLAATSANRSA